MSDPWICPRCAMKCEPCECSSCKGTSGREAGEHDPPWNRGDMIPCWSCKGYGWRELCPSCGWDPYAPPKREE